MNEQKIDEIKELLDQLYCFDKKEIDQLMKRIPYMKEEGLNKLLATLKRGMSEQDEMFKKWAERDPAFAKGLAEVADKTARKLMKKAEKEEHASAEDVLSEL